MDLSIIIVSWNVKNLLKKCLESIFKYPNNLKFEVIVVDNASSDGSQEMIEKNFPQVKLIANKKNLGFAKANNQGILQSQGKYILLLNPDTEIIKKALAKMVNFMKKNPRAGISGCKHLNPDWTIQASVRKFPSLAALFFILSKIAKIFPSIPSVYKYLAKGFDYKKAQIVEQVAGSCFLIRRKTIDEIGLLDENFFIWFEEVDFCLRAKKAGWQIWYHPQAEIIHHGAQSFNQKIGLQKQKLFIKSCLYYFKKHGFKNQQ